MIWSRKTVADLEFPISVGAYSEVPGFQGQRLFASAKFNGFRDVFLRSDDTAGTYFYAQQLNFFAGDAAEGSSWDAECVLHPVDPGQTPAEAKKIALTLDPESRRSVHAVNITSSVDHARRIQTKLDDARAAKEVTEPWLLDPTYAGGYETALWAHDASSRYTDFPVKILNRDLPFLPMFAALRAPEGWPRALSFFTGPTTIPAPSVDGPAATVLVYALPAGEDELVASAAILRGEREPVAELLVGSRDLIREISHD